MGFVEPWNEDIASAERFGCQALRLSFVDQAEGFGAVEDAGACASSISSCGLPRSTGMGRARAGGFARLTGKGWCSNH